MVYESRDLGDKPQGKIKDFCRSSLSRDSTYHAPTGTDELGHSPLRVLHARQGLPSGLSPQFPKACALTMTTLAPVTSVQGPVTCKMSP